MILWLIDLCAPQIQKFKTPVHRLAVQHQPCHLPMKCPSMMNQQQIQRRRQHHHHQEQHPHHPYCIASTIQAMRICLDTVILQRSIWTSANRHISLPTYCPIAIRLLHSSRMRWKIMVPCWSSIASVNTRNALQSSSAFSCTNTIKTFCKYRNWRRKKEVVKLIQLTSAIRLTNFFFSCLLFCTGLRINWSSDYIQI